GGRLRPEQQTRQSELRDFDHRRYGVVAVREELAASTHDRVHVGEVCNVGADPDDVAQLSTRLLDRHLDVPPDLLRLLLGVAWADDPQFLVERDLAGDEEQVANPPGVRVRPRQRMKPTAGLDL